jgi:hypothetical protein
VCVAVSGGAGRDGASSSAALLGLRAARERTPEALPTHRSVLLTQHSAVTTWSRSRWTNTLPLPASASHVRMGPVLSAV